MRRGHGVVCEVATSAVGKPGGVGSRNGGDRDGDINCEGKCVIAGTKKRVGEAISDQVPQKRGKQRKGSIGGRFLGGAKMAVLSSICLCPRQQCDFHVCTSAALRLHELRKYRESVAVWTKKMAAAARARKKTTRKERRKGQRSEGKGQRREEVGSADISAKTSRSAG